MPRPQSAYTWPVLMLIVWCYCASSVAGQCIMEDQPEFSGADVLSSPVPGPTNFDECKTYCLQNDDCVAVEFRSVCLRWTSNPMEFASAGRTISLKDCTSVPECSVTQTADLDASNQAFEVTLSSYTTCEDTCKTLSQCQHAVYITASNTCNLYNTTSSTSSQSGHVSGVKQACPSGGDNCCFAETSDQSRSDTPTLTLNTSLSACEELCLAVDNCNSSIFTGTSCKIFTDVPVTTSASGTTLSQKSCPDGASQGDFTYTTSCDTVPQVPVCSVTQTADTDGSNPAFVGTISSYDTCKDACKELTQCRHAIYVTASNTCNLYNTTTSTIISQSGYMSAVKQACSSGSGQECCFNETADESRSDSPTLTLTASLSACEELCLSVDTCTASVFTGTSCKIFTATPVTSSVSGRTLSRKSCQEGASPGNFTYTSTCNSGSILKSLLAPVVLSFSVLVMFHSQSL